MKPVYFILFTLLFTVGTPGCKKEISNCPDALQYFDINGVEATIYSTMGSKGFDEQLTTYDSTTVENYYINCNYNVTYYSDNSFSLPALFINSAYALSCLENGYGGSKEGLENVYVITKQDFSSTYHSGDTINALVMATDGFNNYMPLEKYVSNNSQGIRFSSVNIKLSEKPGNQAAAHGFTIIFKLKNGEEYTVNTPAVYFY